MDNSNSSLSYFYNRFTFEISKWTCYRIICKVCGKSFTDNRPKKQTAANIRAYLKATGKTVAFGFFY